MKYYTKDDVIIWANDKKLKGALGKTCYYLEWDYQTPYMLLEAVNKGEASISELRIVHDDDTPFGVTVSDYEYGIPFIILKDEKKEKPKKEKKIVPFDFSLKEDRDALMGKRICNEREDIVVTAFANIGGKWILEGNTETGEDILSHWFFADTGKPVGKEVEE